MLKCMKSHRNAHAYSNALGSPLAGWDGGVLDPDSGRGRGGFITTVCTCCVVQLLASTPGPAY